MGRIANGPLAGAALHAIQRRLHSCRQPDEFGHGGRVQIDDRLERQREFMSPDGAQSLRATYFGGAEKLREAIHELQTVLYAA